MQALGFDQPGGGTRVSVFAADGLEGVEAEAYVATVDPLDYGVDGGPGWGDGCPAPIFVGEAEIVGGKEVTEFAEVGGEIVVGGGDVGGV